MDRRRLVSYNKHFEVPHLLSSAFAGCEEDIHRLTTSFAAGQSSQSQHQRQFMLFGLGVGATVIFSYYGLVFQVIYS
jgi:hypothetical protein